MTENDRFVHFVHGKNDRNDRETYGLGHSCIPTCKGSFTNHKHPTPTHPGAQKWTV